MWQQLRRRFGVPLAVAIVSLLGIWLIAMVLLPQWQMIDYSFHPSPPREAVVLAGAVHEPTNEETVDVAAT
ncbi:ABC transporter permease, partial [Salinicola halophyticus]